MADDPPTLFRYQSLFHSYNLEELKMELARLEALEKKQKVPYDTQSLHEQIRLIEKLNTPTDGATFLKFEFEQADALPAELMYLMAKQGNSEAFDSFNRKIGDYFWCLKRMAADGHEDALRSLAVLAIEATEVVNRHVVNRPEVFHPVAAEHTHWPFLKSLNKKLDLIKTDDEDVVLRKLHSGKATQQKLVPSKRSNPHGPAAEVAKNLLDYVRGVRKLSIFIYKGELPPKVQKTDYLAWAGQLPDAAQEQKAPEMWWNLAKKFLLESYPVLGTKSASDLDDLAPTLLKLSAITNQKRRKEKILTNLKTAFMDLLAKPSGALRSSS